MMKHAALYCCATALLLAGCSVIPDSAYENHSSPESLLNVSSERVSLGLTGEQSISELTSWLNEDQPSRVQLSCSAADPLCAKALEVATQFSVPVEYGTETDGGITLIYDRVVAHDCRNKFITNHINPYNLNHPSFGCSTAVNMLQMISDKQQIVSPPLMDYQDGEKAAQTIDTYQKPSEDVTEFKEDLATGGGS